MIEDEEIGIYYVMEYWGADLRETVKTPPRQDWVLDIIGQVLEAVAELHRNGLTHRDIKPENLYLKDGVVKLGDYGLVKSQRLITKLTTIAGTRDYMASEVLAGKAYDYRCDIYSTGIVLWELLTGSTAIPKQKPDNIKEPFWNNMILKATANEPKERYQTAEEFINGFIPFKDNPYKLPWEEIMSDFAEAEKSSKESQLADNDIKTQDARRITHDAQPIFQKLKIQRYPPNPEMRGRDSPGITIETLKPQLEALIKQGDYESALKIGTEYVKAVEKRFGRQNSRTADAIDILAEIFLKLKNYREASSRYGESLELDKKIYGQHSGQYIGSLYHLAQERLEAGDYPRSKDYYTEALALVIKGYNDDAIIRNNLAGVRYLLKEYQEAIVLYQEAIAINEKVVGKISETVTVNLYNLALTYEAIGKTETAQPFYKQAKEILAKLPPDKLTISDSDKEQITGK